MTVQKKARLETITPGMARQWLQNKIGNRRSSLSLVKEYARAMRERRWRVNGETIKISAEGRLIDGQHRLMACVEANCEFSSYIVVGIDSDTFDTVDIGKKRTASDIIGIDGCKNSAATAAAVRWIILFRSGQFNMSNIKTAPDEIRLFLAAEPAVELSASRALMAKKMIAPGLAGALDYLFRIKDPEQTNLYFIDLSTGSNLIPGDPVLVLREKLIRDKMSKLKLQREEIACLCIRAWNHRRHGNTGIIQLKSSVIGADGLRSFPEIM